MQGEARGRRATAERGVVVLVAVPSKPPREGGPHDPVISAAPAASWAARPGTGNPPPGGRGGTARRPTAAGRTRTRRRGPAAWCRVRGSARCLRAGPGPEVERAALQVRPRRPDPAAARAHAVGVHLPAHDRLPVTRCTRPAPTAATARPRRPAGLAPPRARTQRRRSSLGSSRVAGRKPRGRPGAPRGVFSPRPRRRRPPIRPAPASRLPRPASHP
jgi:hypothetical protein